MWKIDFDMFDVPAAVQDAGDGQLLVVTRNDDDTWMAGRHRSDDHSYTTVDRVPSEEEAKRIAELIPIVALGESFELDYEDFTS